ncbi:MAG TPA: dehydrogenase [Chloroflexi bacterium]|nr:dehydrogenase [Chloroflexota bacterium]
MLSPFDYHEPSTLNEAITLLERYGDDARLLAGGTDLLIAMERRKVHPRHVVSLLMIPGLDHLHVDEGITIGALVTHRQLECTSELQGPAVALAEGACVIGGRQVRNVATIGGNICNASPAADTVAPLLALDAHVRLVGPDGQRVVPLDQFFTGPGQTVLAATEILTSIHIPPFGAHTATSFIKFGRRKAMEISIVCVASSVSLSADGHTVDDVRIALGAVAPTPIRAYKAEAFLRGSALTTDAIREAARIASSEARPIDDVRASAEYRRMLVASLVERAIQRSVERIHTGGEEG